MNTILTLLIYNPLEAFFLIRFCDIISKRKFVIKDIRKYYLYGFISFWLQCLPNILYGTDIFAISHVVSSIIILPIILYAYYNISVGRIKFGTCFTAYCILTAVVVLCCFCIYPAFSNIIYCIDIPFVFEFAVNMTILLVRIVILYILRKLVSHYD